MAASARQRASRAGFTLIELLIVVVIIGLLSAMAIPKFAATKTQARMAEMRSDLHNLATAQEAYASDNNAYYAGAVPNAALLYSPSQGVTITIVEGTVSGWSAIASTTYTSRTCAMFVGSAAPVSPAIEEGQIACSP
ncbi:MAG TPA: prepilin-type N-terminal cleavage/methylation domain-containing protein [Gemmatimonadales bacterium]|jgi:prepilin-type N-terminal cleavage/methylation domain-containing protein|nr:prepilin-type N-terminal cleavage/methylation domain-containing protein [Gemmatimonadales bacterium]